MTTTASNNKSIRRKRGFTLSEVIIAASISSVLMSGITSSYMFIFKSSLGASQYVEMSTQSRIGMERFGRDMRMAVDVWEVFHFALQELGNHGVVASVFEKIEALLHAGEGGRQDNPQNHDSHQQLDKRVSSLVTRPKTI